MEEKKITTTDKTDTKKSRFVTIYRAPESGGNISTVCEAVGIARQTYYEWIDKDEQFAKLMYDAKMEQCDLMEQTLYQRGYEKSDAALIFWLKNNHQGYKDKPQMLQQINVGEGDKGNTITFVNFSNDATS